MSTVILNKWDGGQAEDVRTTSLNQSQESNNFDILLEPFRLNPYADSVADTADVAINDSRISDIGVCTIAGTDYIVGVGYESAVSNAVSFYTKSSVTAQFVKSASATGNSFIKGSGVTYKNLAYAVDDNGAGTYRLIRFNSAGSVTTCGSITATSGKPVKCYVHPEDNILYVVISNVISKWDNSSFTSVTTILPLNFSTSSITKYGGYLAIAMNADVGGANPVCLLWGRDTTLNTLQGSLPLGEGYVGVMENLNGNLIFIMSQSGLFSTNNQNRILVKSYSGGAVDTISEIIDSSSLSIGQVTTYKAVKNNRLYFGFGNSDCIWAFGKNKEGRYMITQDRFAINGTQISSNPSMATLSGISVIGDIIWVGQISTTGTYTLMRSGIVSGEGLTYTSTSKYVTTINPNMQVADRYKNKQLESVQLSYTGASTGTTTLKYSVDGSTMTNLIVDTNATGEQIIQATNENTNNLALLAGFEFQFQIECTGGSKPKEIKYKYAVLNDIL